MSDRWDDLRFNATEGEWAARPLGDMRRCLADLLAELDDLAAEVERLRAVKLAAKRWAATQDRNWYTADDAPQLDLLDAIAALTEETTDE